MEIWINLISTVGFPIACCLGLGWFIYNIYKNWTIENQKREDKLYKALNVAHSNNEKLLEANKEFVAVLDTYKNDISEIKHEIVDIKNIIVKGN